jgi:hypothetical protein
MGGHLPVRLGRNLGVGGFRVSFGLVKEIAGRGPVSAQTGWPAKDSNASRPPAWQSPGVTDSKRGYSLTAYRGLTLKQSSRGPEVVVLQRALRVGADGASTYDRGCSQGGPTGCEDDADRCGQWLDMVAIETRMPR